MSKIEIIQLGENEYQIGKTKTSFIEQRIINVTVIGETTTEMAQLHSELVSKLLDMAEGNVNYLIDLNNAGKYSQGAGQIFKNLCGNPIILKSAICGLNPVARVLAAFIVGLNPKKKQKFFKTKEQAMQWLNKL